MSGATYESILERWSHPVTDEDWRNAAACWGTDPDLWFLPDRPQGRRRRRDTRARMRIARAKLICKECPVREECLDWAITADARFGIWGGLTEHERSRITGKRIE